jgi:hypothetical protein
MDGHIYIIGATRSGKTNYMLSEVEGAFAFIDKHGTAARQIADAMKCVYWRPADLEYVVALNPLQNVPPDERWKVTADIVAIFSDIWKLGPETPRLLYYLRASVRLLLDNPSSTLLDIRRVLSDSTYRAFALRKCIDRETKLTWDEFSHKDARQQAQEIGSLQNKVAAMADPLPLRFILGQPTSTIHIGALLSKGTRLVLDLSDLGDEPAAIIGALVINTFKQAADRATQPRPYRLYIDEFQNFGSSVIDTILSESGKRGLWLTLAHQFTSQLDERIRDSVLGNCSTIVAFRLGSEDAPLIGKAIDWSPEDLRDQGRGVARVRTLVDGKPSSAYRMETALTELPTGHLEGNIEFTRANFSRPRKKVEELLHEPQRKEWLRNKGWS